MPSEPVVTEHFGERFRGGKYGLRLARDTYAAPSKASSWGLRRENVRPEAWDAMAWAFEDEEHTRYSDEFCVFMREAPLKNFDLNMAYFSRISSADFDTTLEMVLERNRNVRQVVDLRALDRVQSVYLMVLDDYRQAYIGQSWNIRKRIKSHWAGTKQFDRLIFGDPLESVLSIDAFRPLDTTRIYAAKTINSDDLERKLVAKFPAEYLLNRINGGLVTGFRARFIDIEMKRRTLVPE